MTILSPEYALNCSSEYQEKKLHGRWITLDHLKKILPTYHHSSILNFDSIGKSEEMRAIFRITLGTGKKRVLIWSQMHGNESTGTKALFDLFNYLTQCKDEIAESILSECTLYAIPLLNPDGAQKYTRVNAHEIDLNRDAVDRKAKESKLLRSVLDELQPDFCFNLHDQRTIFGVEGTNNPATISFLAPSEEVTRNVTEGRKRTMNIIVAMNHLLQQIIPAHVGRYTDEFYPTATGDNFQKLGYSTILIESGHYPNDYQREESRKFTFISLLQGIYHIATASNFESYKEYFNIPNNQKNFRDLLLEQKDGRKIAFQYEEILEGNEIKFIPKKVEDDFSAFLFHKKTFS